MDPRTIPAGEYKRLARAAIRGHFWPLTLISALSMLTSLDFTMLSYRAVWLILLTLLLRLIHPLLDYGQKLSFTRRIRGEAYGFNMLLQYGMLPKLLGIWGLRDAVPLALVAAGNFLRAADALSLPGQALQASGFLLNIILFFNYCMAEYMLIDAPALSPVEALRQSRRRLSGLRFQLFLLLLSFLGWVLLLSLILSIIFFAYESASAAALIIVEFLLVLPLMTYIDMSCVAFFEVICRRSARGTPPETAGAASRRPAPALNPDEAAARDMLIRHGFSHRRLRAAGLYEDYRTRNIPPEAEARWRHEWQRRVLRHYSEHPEAMDALLSSAAEHGDAKAFAGALKVMDDALRDGAVIEATIARQALHLLRASDALRDPDPGLRHEIRDGVAGLTDRLEARFQQIDPDGPWQAAISSIRERL